jgi:hypothetical protein
MLVSTTDEIANQHYDFWRWLKDVPLEKLSSGS